MVNDYMSTEEMKMRKHDRPDKEKNLGKIKILNLYAGIGGNRKLWEEVVDVDVTAVEIEEEIAQIYQDFFPQDKVVIGDAHKYLKENYQDYDFIWSSPPCASHSKMRLVGSKSGSYEPVYPNMELYEEILFLKHYFDGKWVVENVNPFYETLVEAQEIGRHLFWSNFKIFDISFDDEKTHNERGYIEDSWFDLSEYSTSKRKDQIIRNCVAPKLGKHILKSAFKKKVEKLEAFV